ncbi:hypothetical protein ABPG74_002574 [Tetrahymena malaccensis]
MEDQNKISYQQQKKHILFDFFTDLKNLEGEKLKYGIQELCHIFDELLSLEYIITHFIGNGGEGPVFAVEKDQQKFAVKCVVILDIQAIERQEKILSLINNKPYILKFIKGLYSKNNKYYFQITEKLDCDLEFLMKQKVFKLNQIISFANQMTWALYVLEQNNIFHLDIKPQNILYDMTNGCFKLADYGFSKIKNNVNLSHTININGGSWKYISPEAMNDLSEYNTKTDIYSLGLIFLELTLGRLLTREEAIQIRQNQQNINKFLSKKKEFNEFNQIIQQMLMQERKQRISLESIQKYLRQIQEMQYTIFVSNIEANELENLDQEILNDLKHIYLQSLNKVKFKIQNNLKSTKINSINNKINQIKSIQQTFIKFLKFENIHTFSKASLNQRWLRELQYIYKNIHYLSENGVIIKYWYGNQIYFSLLGLENSLYDNFMIHGYLEINEDYPYKPPKCILQSQLFHPYVEYIDKIVITNIDIFILEWNPSLSIDAAFISLQSALNENINIYEDNCGFNLKQSINMINYAKKSLLTFQQFINKLENEQDYYEKVKNQCD